METTFAKSIGSSDFVSRAGVVATVGLISTLAAYQQSSSSWYPDLIKPASTPTIGIIIIISIIIYVLYLWCWFRALQVVTPAHRLQVDGLFCCGLLLQSLWIFTFFTQQDPSNAKKIMALLMLFIVFMVWYLWRILKLGDCALLMSVSMVWTAFLTYINFNVIDNTPKPKIGSQIDQMPLRSRRLHSSSVVNPSEQD
jgi:tryptophan-rich sensory protein